MTEVRPTSTVLSLEPVAASDAVSVPDPFVPIKLFGRSVQSVVAALIQTGGKAAFGLILPLILAPSEYGDYVYLIWMTTIVIQVGSLGMPQAAQRFIPTALHQGQQSISKLLALFPMLSGTTAALLVCTWFLLSPSRDFSAFQIGLCAFLIVSGECILVWSAILRGSLQFNTITLAELVGFCSRCFLIGLIMAKGTRVTLSLVMAAEAASVGIQTFWLWRRNWNTWQPHVEATLDRIVKHALVKYALGVWAIAIIDNLLWRVEIAFLHHYISSSAAAIFNVTNQVTLAAILIPNAAITALFPSFAGLTTRLNGETGSLYRSATTLIWAATLPFYLLATAGGLLLLSIYGSRYGETSSILPLLMVSRTLIVAACASSTVLCAIGEQRRLLYIVALGACLNVLGNAVLVPRFGLAGAVACASIFQPSVSIATIWIAHRALGGRLALSRITIVVSVVLLYVGAFGFRYGHLSWILLLCIASIGIFLLDQQARKSLQSIGAVVRFARQF